MGGVGVVVRDPASDFVAGCAMALDNVFSAAHVEALVACVGFSLAINRGFKNVSFKSDSFEIIGDGFIHVR